MYLNHRVGRVVIVLSLLINGQVASGQTEPLPLGPTEAAKQAGKKVTMEFVARGAGLNPPVDSEELDSEPTWQHSEAFIVRFIGPVRAELKGRNVPTLSEHFMRQKSRVTGYVKQVGIDGKLRPAIDVAKLDDFEVVSGDTWPSEPLPLLELNLLKKRKLDLRPTLRRSCGSRAVKLPTASQFEWRICKPPESTDKAALYA